MTDDFDFDDDALPDLDAETVAALDGEAAEQLARRRRRLVNALLSGSTGVDFASLALFAEPLFSLYDLDPTDAFRLATEPDAVADDAVALLETARVLWAFLSLPTAEQAHERQALAAQLVGEDPTDDDWVGLDGLVETASIHWKALLPEEIQAAQQTGHDTLDFCELLAHPAFHLGEDDFDSAHDGYGAGDLSEIEARALFAQPLLEAAGDLTDEAAFEDALARADGYWALARRGDLSDEAYRAYATEHAGARGPDAVEREAREMVGRYQELFG